MSNKETHYFSHDSNSRNDEKILAVRMRLGAEGYGIFFMILEKLRDSSDGTLIKDYNIIAFDLRASSDKIKQVVEDFGLFSFTDDGKRFYSERMQRNIQIIKEKSDKARQKVQKRWEKEAEKQQDNTIVLPQYYHSNTNKIKESKVKEIKDISPLTPQRGENEKIFPSENFSDENSSLTKPPKEEKEKSCAKKEKDPADYKPALADRNAVNSDDDPEDEEIQETGEKNRNTGRFRPPTIDEVEMYCRERQNAVNAVTFWNFYEAKGWYVGKNKMKNWKACVRTWETKQKQELTQQPKTNGNLQKAFRR